MRMEWIEGRIKKSPLSTSEKKQIQDAYLELFHTEMRGNCDNCYHDALIEIYIKIKPMGNFILKSGVVIVYPDGKMYTNVNLTDTVAAWYLKQDSRNRNHFIKVKEAVKEDSDNTDSVSTEPASTEPTSTEPKSKIKQSKTKK